MFAKRTKPHPPLLYSYNPKCLDSRTVLTHPALTPYLSGIQTAVKKSSVPDVALWLLHVHKHARSSHGCFSFFLIQLPKQLVLHNQTGTANHFTLHDSIFYHCATLFLLTGTRSRNRCDLVTPPLPLCLTFCPCDDQQPASARGIEQLGLGLHESDKNLVTLRVSQIWS